MMPTTRFARRAAFCLGAVLLALPAQLARAQPVQPPEDDLLREAIAAYRAADYERAIPGFDALAKDDDVEEAVRSSALQYLGITYLSRNEYEKAREAIYRMLELEPPLVSLDGTIRYPPLERLYWEVRKDYTGSYQVEREDPGMKTLAVMDFANHSIDEKERFDPMQLGFASAMTGHLQGGTELKVVERERIQWLLGELELQRDGTVVDQGSAVQAGRLLGVTAVLFGSFIIQGKKMWLTARLVKVETGEILFVEQVEGKWSDFMDLADDLAAQVADAIDVEVAGEDGGTRSGEAFLAYAQGLELIEQERYQEAYDKFTEALDLDPSYAAARQEAESIEHLLG